MKLSLRLFFLAVILAGATPKLAAAERWSTDEAALRMGIRSWLALQSGAPQAGSSTSIQKALYVTVPTTVAPSKCGRSAPPENVSVKLQGNQATTTFQLSQPLTEVILAWERKGGLWKIAQETVTPVSRPAEQVALSGSSLK